MNNSIKRQHFPLSDDFYLISRTPRSRTEPAFHREQPKVIKDSGRNRNTKPFLSYSFNHLVTPYLGTRWGVARLGTNPVLIKVAKQKHCDFCSFLIMALLLPSATDHCQKLFPGLHCSCALKAAASHCGAGLPCSTDARVKPSWLCVLSVDRIIPECHHVMHKLHVTYLWYTGN